MCVKKLIKNSQPFVKKMKKCHSQPQGGDFLTETVQLVKSVVTKSRNGSFLPT